MDEQQRRAANRAVFLRMMDALGRKDWDEGFALTIEDLLCDWPYPPLEGMAEAIEGREAVRRFFDEGQAPMAGLDYRIDAIHDALDPDLLISEYHSVSRHLATGVPYGNRYLGILRFRDGKVCYWREYINPLKIAEMLNRSAAAAAPGAGG
ncbi:MAG: nuclear transport factor 2 family protein [Gammaproteobacteria bacterium]